MKLEKLGKLQPYLCILAAIVIFYLLYTYGVPRNESFQVGGSDSSSEAATNQIMLPGYLTSAKPEPVPPAPLPEDEMAKSHLLIEVPNKIMCHTDEDCNIIYGNGKNKCLSGKCQCQEGTGRFCHKTPNYYKDPKDMTPAQIIKFKNKAKVEKMTIGDYKNWLMLFKYDQENLPRYHLPNFQRLMMGQPIYDIPLSDPVEEYFSDSPAKRDRVCLEIPNAEIDSPLNWKIHSQLNNTGRIDRHGRTERPLNWSRYYKHPSLNKDRYQRSDKLTVKDWFLNNVNWLFYDVDRNAYYQDPNSNRFMNIIGDKRAPQPTFKPQRLVNESDLSPLQQGSIVPASDSSNMPAGVPEVTGELAAGNFTFSGDA